MSSLPNQSVRLDFRLTPDHKSLIERAAHAMGQTVSSFATSVLLRASEDVIERETNRVLSERDAELFVNLLASDAEPNEALKAAAERYKSRVGGNPA